MPNISRTALETRNGRAIDYEKVRGHDLSISDIAASLSKLCRYNGHTNRFYSVAEHCLILAKYASENISAQAGLQMLLHDAAECYIGDYPLPMKRLIKQVGEMEDKFDELVCLRFGLPHPFPAFVRELDSRIVLDEKAALYPSSRWAWAAEQDALKPLGVADEIRGLYPDAAEVLYLQAFSELIRTR